MAKKDNDDVTDDTFEGGDGSVMIDLSDVKEASFEVVPKGKYEAIIEECEYKLSANSGQPMWSLTLQITDGEYAGRKLFSHVSFSPKALPMAKKTINRLAPELSVGPFNPKESAGIMQGKACVIKVSVEKYEGNDTNRVKDIMAEGTLAGGTGGFI